MLLKSLKTFHRTIYEKVLYVDCNTEDMICIVTCVTCNILKKLYRNLIIDLRSKKLGLNI